MDKIDTLINFVRANYDKGAHWIFETHDRDDYEQILVNLGGDLRKAKSYLRNKWQVLEEQCRAVQGEIF